MGKILLKTIIHASIEICFDLSLSVDLHTASASHTNEFVFKGRKSGVLELNEEITWRAKHFGVWQNLTVKITELNRPNYFVDEMVKGAFKSIRHVHNFTYENNHTIMTDEFVYSVPLGILGKIFDRLILENYMRRFLIKRNETIRKFAESDSTLQSS